MDDNDYTVRLRMLDHNNQHGEALRISTQSLRVSARRGFAYPPSWALRISTEGLCISAQMGSAYQPGWAPHISLDDNCVSAQMGIGYQPGWTMHISPNGLSVSARRDSVYQPGWAPRGCSQNWIAKILSKHYSIKRPPLICVLLVFFILCLNNTKSP